MPLTIADRVRETTTTTGTGTVTLAGAVSGYRTFTSMVATGDQCNYVISLGAEWEVGVGTLATSTTLARTTVLASSNANGLVSFSAGTKDVFLTQPAGLMNSMLQRNRNLVDNGAMNICQRATSVAAITAGGYWTLDRWLVNISALGTWTMSQTTDGPTGSGITKCLKMLATTADATPAAGDYVLLAQAIEGQFLQHILKGTAAAKNLTLSFWVKSNITGNYIAELYDYDNTRFVSAAYTISVSDTWEFKTITFPADTTGTFTNDNGTSLGVNFWLAAGSTYSGGASLGTTWQTTDNKRAFGQVNVASAGTTQYWQVTGVQLEVGPVPTPYETQTFNDELIRCQRYFEKSYNYADAPATNTAVGCLYTIGRANTTASLDPGPSITFKVRKRATPTMSFWRLDGSVGTWLWNAGSGTPTVYQAGEVGFATYVTGLSGFTVGLGYIVTGHWTATADL